MIRPVAAPIVGIGGGEAFSPSTLANVREWTLDGTPYYDAGSPLSNLPTLRSRESYGTYRAPRQGRCWLFDGTNDRGVLSSVVSLTGVFAFTFHVRPSSNSVTVISGRSENNNSSIIYNNSSGNITVETLTNSSSAFATSLSTSTFQHIAIVRNESNIVTVYKNGVFIGSQTVAGTLEIGQFGARNGTSPTLFFPGSLRDIRIYNVAKDATAIAAIYAGTDDTTGLLAHYPCNEESGTVGYDISGNANHLTLTNITQATFHAADTGVTANRNNVHGYRLSGSVYIPKRLTTDLAADGNALTVTGQSPYPVATESPCVTGDGSAAYVNLGSALIPATADFDMSVVYYYPGGSIRDTVVFQTTSFFIIANSNGTAGRLGIQIGAALTEYSGALTSIGHYTIRLARVSGVVTCYVNGVSIGSPTNGIISLYSNLLLGSYGAINFYTSGRIADLRITTGGVTTYFPLQDGPGSSNTNRNVAWYKSDGTYGVLSNAIVNGTVANIWANRCPNVQDHSINHGGRLGAAGEFILGVPNTEICADGNAKTLSAGKHGNPFSRLNLNPFTAAELNGRSLPTALAPGGSLASVTPSESAFMRSDTDGDDRLIVTAAALTGSDLTNVEAYTA